MSISIQMKTRIIEEKINNPEISLRAITEIIGKEFKTKVNHSTVKNVIDAYINKDLIKVPTVYDTLQTNDNIISLGKKTLEEAFWKISEGKKKWLKIERMQDLKTISDIIDTAFKQNQLIKWWPTENLWVGIQITDAQKQMIAAKYFNPKYKEIWVDELPQETQN